MYRQVHICRVNKLHVLFQATRAQPCVWSLLGSIVGNPVRQHRHFEVIHQYRSFAKRLVPKFGTTPRWRHQVNVGRPGLQVAELFQPMGQPFCITKYFNLCLAGTNLVCVSNLYCDHIFNSQLGNFSYLGVHRSFLVDSRPPAKALRSSSPHQKSPNIPRSTVVRVGGRSALRLPMTRMSPCYRSKLYEQFFASDAFTIVMGLTTFRFHFHVGNRKH